MNMNNRQRFHATLDGQPVDRLPLIEWASWWRLTLDRWYKEGLPADCQAGDIIQAHFGLDVHTQLWGHGIHWDCPYRAPHHGAGIWEVAGEDLAAIEPYLGRGPVLIPDDAPWRPAYERGDQLFWFTVPGFFWLPRTIFGIENHLFAFYDEPEVMHRINDLNADWIIRYVDELCERVQPDFMTFAEDMSYNHGPMIGRDLWDTFIAPYYHKVIPHLKSKGIRCFIDSDGDITSCAPWFVDCGLDGVLPCERQAGVDVEALRTAVPELQIIGGYDKLVMCKGEAAMRAEFERLLPAMQRGGFIPSVDHQTPPEVSYDQYQTYVTLLREYAERAARSPCPTQA